MTLELSEDRIRVETFPDLDLFHIAVEGPYQDFAPAAWCSLWQWLNSSNQAQKITRLVGFGLDNPRLIPQDRLRYIAGAELSAVPDGEMGNDIKRERFAGGRFVVYRMQGDYKQMPDYFRMLHDEWLPQSGYIPDYCRAFWEIYVNNPQEVGLENALTDLCLPIREDPHS